MLKFQDLFHLPQLDPLVEQLVTGGSGLLIVAGLDPRPQPASDDRFLPSGRSAVFRVLLHEILTARPAVHCTVITKDRSIVRPSRQLQRRIKFLQVDSSHTYSHWIDQATRRQPDLLVVDRLSADTAPAVLEAAQQGVWILSQLDTVFRGAGVARHLLDWGVLPEQLGGLSEVLTVQRLPALCPHCKQPAPPDPGQLDLVRRRCPDIAEPSLLEANGCAHCHHSGRLGDVAVFDFFQAQEATGNLCEQASLLPAEEYVLRLASAGYLSVDDFLQFESNQLRWTFNLLAASEQSLVKTNTELNHKFAELEAAHQVLLQRTEALISLQDIGQALITSSDLNDLATRVCRRARDLCSADHTVLYILRPDDQAEILAVTGWEPSLIHSILDAALLSLTTSEPSPFEGQPPGIAQPRQEPLKAGLCVPLVAQQKPVGLMIVQATKKRRFEPGEVAMLQTFANQAALAIQRAELIEQLRLKISQLETAQAELIQKERLERELELARQVQQSVLPHTFPQIPGYQFAAQNEPARQVGGDFYDAFPLDAHRFGLVIADVSDKGMPAALYMALTRSLILAEARREDSPHTVLTNVNQLLRELGEPNMFVTVFYGIVEQATQRMRYTRAGHDRPILLREGEAWELEGEGTILGLLDPDDLYLTEEQTTLAPGDRLVLYTDGLTDVLSPTGQLFDREQLKALLQSHATCSPSELCDATFTDLKTYQGDAEQYDDMTMLVVSIE